MNPGSVVLNGLRTLRYGGNRFCAQIGFGECISSMFSTIVSFCRQGLEVLGLNSLDFLSLGESFFDGEDASATC